MVWGGLFGATECGQTVGSFPPQPRIETAVPDIFSVLTPTSHVTVQIPTGLPLCSKVPWPVPPHSALEGLVGSRDNIEGSGSLTPLRLRPQEITGTRRANPTTSPPQPRPSLFLHAILPGLLIPPHRVTRGAADWGATPADLAGAS